MEKQASACRAAVRPVRDGDEQTLALIQTESWKAAFSSILDADTLARLTQPDKATAMYKRLLDARKGHGYLLEVDGRPHAIAWWDAERTGALPGYAELICIHSLPDRWRCGFGSQLMNEVLNDMRTQGYQHAMLWVFRDNERAIGFYRKHGFVPNGMQQQALGAMEVAYARAL